MTRRASKKWRWVSVFLSVFGGTLLLSPPAYSSEPLHHTVFSQILRQYVSKKGLVNYRGFKRDKDAMESLAAYLTDLMKIDSTRLEPIEEQKAYWLNLYNGLVLQEILKRYPVKTVAQIPHFFDRIRYAVAGYPGKMSLLDIETKVFQEKFNDPRLIFGRVNGAMSAPPLPLEAYEGPTLEKLLEKVIFVFLLDAQKNYYDPNRKVFYASPLFLWFQEDFEKWAVSNRVFIGKRLGLPLNYRLEFTGFDWKLNDTKYR